MNRGSKLAMTIILILLFYVLLVLWRANSQCKPYESPPVHMLTEEREIKAAFKRHGDIMAITTKTRIYFERNGREILIARRGI